MRMRKRPNLGPRMEKCAELLIGEPELLKGRWAESFPGFDELRLELGCGKGRFTVETAAAEPGVFFLALERSADAMIIALERAKARELRNLAFIRADADRLGDIFAPGELSRIYINFCDPWPKSRDAKFRLTAPGFLRRYGELLPIGGEIHFKTDNLPLFDWSLNQFKEEGWEIRELSHDLHGHGPTGVMTDYEAKFHSQGIRINRLAAVRGEKTLDSRAGALPRLRNAALADARGISQGEAE